MQVEEPRTIEQLWEEIQRGEMAIREGQELLIKLRGELGRNLGRVGGRLRGEVLEQPKTKTPRKPIDWSGKLPVFALSLVGLIAGLSLILQVFPTVDYGFARTVPTWALLLGTIGIVFALTIIVLVGFLSVFSAYLTGKYVLGLQQPQMPMQYYQPPVGPQQGFESGSYDEVPERPVPVQAMREVGRKGDFSDDPALQAYLKKMQEGELGPDDFSMLGPDVV